MLISIEGNIIDTKNIYKITKVSSNISFGGREYIPSHYGPGHYGNKPASATFSFIIKLFNGERIKIEKKAWREIEYLNKTLISKKDKEVFKEDVDILRLRVEAMRSEIVNYWNQDQSRIPQIELSKNEQTSKETSKKSKDSDGKI